MIQAKCIAVAIGFSFSSYCFADPMQDVFNDMYEVSAPSASQHGNGRYGVNLGGFSYRPKVSHSQNLLSARMPRMNVGPCGDIDIFAGSFSLISGDELAQLARGIMQGAAGYAFNLALQSISPMSAQVVEDLKAFIDAANKANINGCQLGANLAMAAQGDSTVPQAGEVSFAADQLRSATAFLGQVEDFSSAQYGETRQKPLSDLAEETGKKIAQNSFIKSIKQVQPDGGLFQEFGGIKQNEIALTIFGATILTTDLGSCDEPPPDGEKTCITTLEPKGAKFFADFFFDADDIDGDTDTFKFKYYKCADDDCLNATEAEGTATRLLPKLKKDLNAVWQKSYKDPERVYTPEEANLVYWFGNDMYTMMQVFGPNDQFGQSYAKFKSIEATAYMMDYFAQDLFSKVNAAILKSKATSNPDTPFPVGLSATEDAVKLFSQEYKTLKDSDINPRIEENRHNLGTQLNIMLYKG